MCILMTVSNWLYRRGGVNKNWNTVRGLTYVVLFIEQVQRLEVKVYTTNGESIK